MNSSSSRKGVNRPFKKTINGSPRTRHRERERDPTFNRIPRVVIFIDSSERFYRLGIIIILPFLCFSFYKNRPSSLVCRDISQITRGSHRQVDTVAIRLFRDFSLIMRQRNVARRYMYIAVLGGFVEITWRRNCG